VEFWFPGPVPETRFSDMIPSVVGRQAYVQGPPLLLDVQPFLTQDLTPVPDLAIYGVTAGECADAETWDLRYQESRLRWLEGICVERRPGLILFPASQSGHELGARLAARLNCGCFPKTRTLFQEGERLFARKKACGSNLDWDAEIKALPAVLTVTGGKTSRINSWIDSKTGCRIDSRIETGEKMPFPVEHRPAKFPRLPPWILDYEQSEAFPVNSLESAPLIFAAGRGLGSKAACDRLRRTAGRFGAPLGFSRPAALNGWGEIGEIIGQSGLRCAAETCVAVGLSGAAAFMAGIESVSILIAVNPDKNAPIFRYADIGIVTGAEEFIAALETGVETEKG
jgi:electron transfer flavoprotein alpha subunit